MSTQLTERVTGRPPPPITVYAAPASVAPIARHRAWFGIAGAPFVGILIFAAPPLFFPAMADDLGVSVPVLGQVVTAMLLLSAALALAIGSLVERYGYRRLQTIGTLSAAGCLLGYGLAPAAVALIVPALLGGLTAATLPGLTIAMAAANFTGAEQRRAIGVITASTAGSAVVGVPLLAAIGALAGWRVALLVAGFCALAIALLLPGSLPRDRKLSKTAARPRTILAAYHPLLRHRPIRRLLLANALRSVCWTGMTTYFGALLTEELGLGTGVIGLAYLLAGSGYIAGSLLTPRLLGRLPLRPFLPAMLSALALLIGVVTSGALGGLGTVAVQPLLTVVSAAGVVGLTTALTVIAAPARLGAAMSLNVALANLGAAGGGLLGGLVVAVGGYHTLALVLTPIGLLAAFLMIAAPGPDRRLRA